MKRILLAALAFTIGVAPMAASAGEVYNRLESQTDRINAGIASGQLTRGEAARLQAEQNSIDAARERDLAMHGGRLTPAEYARLNARENALSQRIYTLKHNYRHR